MSPRLRSAFLRRRQGNRAPSPHRIVALQPPSEAVWLIVGLGNHGRGYSHNRHNVGFWCVNRLGRSYAIPLRTHTSLATTGLGMIEGRQAILAKPRTYVNNSGDAVAALVRRYSVPPQRLLVICDSLDLPVGAVRVRRSGSHGGQKGLKSIIDRLGVNSFPRIRIGIGRPVIGGEPVYERELIAEYVLSDTPRDERQALDAAVETVIAAVACIMEEGLEAAMNRFNREQE
jgi:PTH1 family peptidyl-tRNA hydrolase